MAAFMTTLDQMMFLFLCMLIGYVLNKKKILAEDADLLISRLENYVFVPALVINSFSVNCTAQNLADNAIPILYSAAFLGLSIVIALVLAPRFANNDFEKGVYRYSLAVSNYGFMGNSLAQGLLGDAMLFRYLMFTLPHNFFVYSAGIIWLTAGKRKFSPKMLLNPAMIATGIGMVLGLTQLPLPSFVVKTLSGCAGCFSPLAMVLTGFVIAKFDLLQLVKQWKVYIITLLRSVAIPLLFFGIMVALGLPQDLRILVMLCSAMPLGLNPIVFPAAYGGDETPGASMAVVSNIIGLVTVPLMLSLVL